MNKFWLWMIKKGYAFSEETIDSSNNKFTTQMLIGYMIEYTGINDVDVLLIEELYDDLLQEIEQISKEEIS